MFNRINSILLLVAAASGCGTNPCDVGLLFANMTPEQQANCAECSNAYDCPDDDGETGEDEVEPDDWLTCQPGIAEGFPQPNEVWCFVGIRHDLVPAMADQVECDEYGGCSHAWVRRPASSCPQLTEPVACDRTWSGGGDDMCVLCEAAGPAPQQPLGVGEWTMCPWSGEFIPATTMNGAGPYWFEHLGCGPGNAAAPGTCAPVQIGIGYFTNWTCACPSGSDDECVGGMVCEQGWVLEGLYPHPTLCAWDGAPIISGPEVYGLEQWSDGVVRDGDVITIDPTLLVDVWPYEGQPFPLLNDDQRIDERGTITHCGTGSLCEHLGLAVGERLVLDGFDVETLVNGGVVLLEVERPRVGSRWLTITVDGV